MQLFQALLTFAIVATALPWSEQNSIQPQLLGSDGALMKSAQCKIGQQYCFSQIVGDLRVAKQDILHQYCDQKSVTDWQSCNTCKRMPVPLPRCWDGPAAWSSVFKCTGPETYKWIGRCDGEGSMCAAGSCRWAKVGKAGEPALFGNSTPTAS